METALTIFIALLIFVIAALLYSVHRDKKEFSNENEKAETTNEIKIRLQFEKAKSDINLQNKKAYFYNSLGDLIGLINVLLVISIIVSGILFIAGMAGCASILNI